MPFSADGYYSDSSTFSEGIYSHGPEKRDWLPEFRGGGQQPWDGPPTTYPYVIQHSDTQQALAPSGLVPAADAHYYSGYWAAVQADLYRDAVPAIHPYGFVIERAVVGNPHPFGYPQRWGGPKPWDDRPGVIPDLDNPEPDTREASDDDEGLTPTLASYDPLQADPFPFQPRIPMRHDDPFRDLIDRNQSIDWRGAVIFLETVAPMSNDGLDVFASISSQLSGDTRRGAELFDTGSHLTLLMPFFPLYPDLSYPSFMRFFTGSPRTSFMPVEFP